MKLLESVWNEAQRKYKRTWLADNDSDITADFDADSASGSTIIVVTSGTVYTKNTQDKWQEFGGTKIIA